MVPNKKKKEAKKEGERERERRREREREAEAEEEEEESVEVREKVRLRSRDPELLCCCLFSCFFGTALSIRFSIPLSRDSILSSVLSLSCKDGRKQRRTRKKEKK